MYHSSQHLGIWSGYMELVSRRDAQTLLPIIQAHVLPGTIIYSDEWAAYNQVQNIPNVTAHATVNHSLHFVDPQTDVHTQNISSCWNRVKYRIKHMKGVHVHQLASYLDEFMWRERHGQTTSGFRTHHEGHQCSIPCVSLSCVRSQQD